MYAGTPVICVASGGPLEVRHSSLSFHDFSSTLCLKLHSNHDISQLSLSYVQFTDSPPRLHRVSL